MQTTSLIDISRHFKKKAAMWPFLVLRAPYLLQLHSAHCAALAEQHPTGCAPCPHASSAACYSLARRTCVTCRSCSRRVGHRSDNFRHCFGRNPFARQASCCCWHTDWVPSGCPPLPNILHRTATTVLHVRHLMRVGRTLKLPPWRSVAHSRMMRWACQRSCT